MKKLIKYTAIILLLSIFVGCAKNEPAKQFSSKEFQGVNKDALLNAAKKVIRLSDSEFEIQAKRESLKAFKNNPNYEGFNLDINENTIEMFVYQEDNSTIGKVKFTHKKSVLEDDEKVITGDIHNLFWNRVDYLLGFNEKWPSCAMHRITLNFDGILCDIVRNENNTPLETDKISNIGFASNKPEYKKELKIASLDLEAMKAVRLPFVVAKEDTNSITQIEEVPASDDLEIEITEEVLEDDNESNVTQNNEEVLVE